MADSGQALPNFDKLWDFDHPEKTEEVFRALLGQAQAQASGDRSYLLQLQTQIARCQGLRNQFDQAQATLDQVQAQLTDDPLPRVRYLLERGRVFNSSDKPDRGMEPFAEAHRLAESAGLARYAIDALHMLAIAAPTMQEKIDWNLRSLALIEKYPKQAGWLPSVYNNLGEAYRAQGQLNQSLQCFEKILELDRAAGREPWLYNRIDQVRLLRLLGRVDEALGLIQGIAEELRSSGQSDGFVEEELGLCLAAAGRQSEAQGHCAKALELLQSEAWLAKQEPQRLARLKELASG